MAEVCFLGFLLFWSAWALAVLRHSGSQCGVSWTANRDDLGVSRRRRTRRKNIVLLNGEVLDLEKMCDGQFFPVYS